MIGKLKQRIGTATPVTVGRPLQPLKERAPKAKPINRLPESPIKMLAGWKLKGRNPSSVPKRAQESIVARSLCRTRDMAMTTIVESNAVPTANPSSPSIRLKAFVMSKIHMTVSANPTGSPIACPPNDKSRL